VEQSIGDSIFSYHREYGEISPHGEGTRNSCGEIISKIQNDWRFQARWTVWWPSPKRIDSAADSGGVKTHARIGLESRRRRSNHDLLISSLTLRVEGKCSLRL
jgi:hypothetical protein